MALLYSSPFYLGSEDLDLTILSHIKDSETFLATIQVNRYISNLVRLGWRGSLWKTLLERKLEKIFPFAPEVNYRKEYLKYLFQKIPREIASIRNPCCKSVTSSEETSSVQELSSGVIPEAALDLGPKTLDFVKERLSTVYDEEITIHSFHLAFISGRDDVIYFFLGLFGQEIQTSLRCRAHQSLWGLDLSAIKFAHPDRIALLENSISLGSFLFPHHKDRWVPAIIERQNINILKKIDYQLDCWYHNNLIKNAIPVWAENSTLILEFISYLLEIHSGTRKTAHPINVVLHLENIAKIRDYPLEVYQGALNMGVVFPKPPKIGILEKLTGITIKAQEIWMKYALKVPTGYLKEKRYLVSLNPTLANLIDPKCHFPSVISSYGLVFPYIPSKIYKEALNFLLNSETSGYDPIKRRKIYVKDVMVNTPASVRAWASILSLRDMKTPTADWILNSITRLTGGRTYEEALHYVRIFFGGHDRLRPSREALLGALQRVRKYKPHPYREEIYTLLASQ